MNEKPGNHLGWASLWMLISTTILNISMVGFHRVMSGGWSWGIEVIGLGDDYAELVALSGVYQVLAVQVMGMSAWLTKVFARDVELAGSGAARQRLFELAPKISLLALLAGGAILLATPLVVRLLKLENPWGWWMVAGTFVVGLVAMVLRAFAQGLHRFNPFGLSLAAEGLGRFFFGLAVLKAGFGVAGAMFSAILGQGLGIVAAASCFFGLGEKKEVPQWEEGQHQRSMRYKSILSDVAALGLFSFLVMLDILVVKHYWPAGPASLYSRAAVVAKSFLYLAAALMLVLLPAVASARARGEDTRPILLKFLAASAIFQGVGLIVVWFQTDFVISILNGSQVEFLAQAPLIRAFSLAVIPLSLFQLVLYYLVGRQSRWVTPLMVVAVAVFGAALWWRHDNAGQIVTSLAVVAVGMLIVGFVTAMRPEKNRVVEGARG